MESIRTNDKIFCGNSQERTDMQPTEFNGITHLTKFFKGTATIQPSVPVLSSGSLEQTNSLEFVDKVTRDCSAVSTQT